MNCICEIKEFGKKRQKYFLALIMLLPLPFMYQNCGSQPGLDSSASTNTLNAANIASAPIPSGGTAGGGTAAVSLSECIAKGFNPHLIQVPYNTTPPSGQFGNSDALVIQFTTPSVGSVSQLRFGPANYPPYQGTTQLSTLSTSPCQFASNNLPSGSIISAKVGPTEGFTMLVGGSCPYSNPMYCGAGPAYLQPNTTYYITVVNRDGFFGTPNFVNTCPSDSCPLRLDFYAN